MESSRRQVLGSTVGTVGAVAATAARRFAQATRTSQRPANEPFGDRLNTSTTPGNGFDIVSIELFNRESRTKSADENLQTGLEATRSVVQQAIA
jgi:hypothetical protein